MQKYIDVKSINAEPMTRGEYNKERNWIIPINENPDDPGYLVRHSNGHITWSPKEIFEKQSFLFRGVNNSVTKEDVIAFIKQIHTEVIVPNDKDTRIIVVTVTLINGFTTTESFTYVNPKNNDIEIGIDQCMKRIEDKVGVLLGFLLSCSINGFNNGGK